MRNIFLPAVIMFFIVSCISNESSQNNTDNTTKIMISQRICYASYSSNDTILLKIEVFPNVITGILKYQIWEKDKNEGTIDGIVEDNKIFADYTFSSEGQTSVREVAFLIKEDIAIEGFGEMEEQNGKMVFKDKTKIDFSEGLKFTKIDCAQNDSKFR